MANQIHSIRLIRRKEVESRTGLSRSTIYERIKQHKFPPPVSLGARAVAWVSSEIDEWIQEQVTQCRKV